MSFSGLFQHWTALGRLRHGKLACWHGQCFGHEKRVAWSKATVPSDNVRTSSPASAGSRPICGSARRARPSGSAGRWRRCRRSPRYNDEPIGDFDRPAYEKIDGVAALLTEAARLARPLGIDRSDVPMDGGGSDGNLTAAVGIPTLDGMGVEGAGAHAWEDALRRSQDRLGWAVSSTPKQSSCVFGGCRHLAECMPLSFRCSSTR